jgi:hypothetical protein
MNVENIEKPVHDWMQVIAKEIDICSDKHEDCGKCSNTLTCFNWWNYTVTTTRKPNQNMINALLYEFHNVVKLQDNTMI